MEEGDYKPDFEICDRYVSFSSELLRISLLAITGIGGLIVFTFQKDSTLILFRSDKISFMLTITLFALTAGTSLIHRFYASDSISFHIAYLRKKTQEEKDGRSKSLKRSEFWLIVTEYLFGSSLIAFVVALIFFLKYHF